MSQVENVIDIKDLFKELIKKWWLIVLCTCIFALALGGYKYVTELQGMKNAESDKGELTKEEKKDALEYISVVEQLEEIESYMDHSILLNCNPYNVYCTELQFVIGGDVEEENISTIRAAYYDYMTYNRLASDMAAENKKYDVRALHEVLVTDTENSPQDPSLKTLRLMVYAKDKKQAAALTESAKEQIYAYSDQLKETIGSHEFMLLDEDTSPIMIVEIKEKKAYFEDTFKLLEEKEMLMVGQLNSLQKQYVQNQLGVDKKVEEVNSSFINFKSVLKFAILGAAVGCLGGMVLIIAFYFFTDHVKTEKEIEYLYEIKHMGDYKNINDISRQLVSVCKEKGIEKIAFIGTVKEKEEKILTDIRETLGENKIETILVEADSENDMELPKDGVVLITLRKTRVEEVDKMIKTFTKKGMNLYGYLTFS